MLEISTELLARLLAEAAASPLVEVCGLLWGGEGRITRAERCRNVDPDPARAFEIDPAALLAAYRAMRGGGPRLLGWYHSHPSGDATPSARDAANAAPDGMIWLILAGSEARAWRAVTDGMVEGRFDPVTLALAACAPDGASPERRQA